MKKSLMACVGAVMLLSAVAFAKEPHFYQRGRLMSMDSVSCGYAEKSGKTIKGEILGTDGGHKNTKELLCQEYLLRTDQVLYRIRPRDDKHPILLPVGEVAEFRLYKDRVYLKISESDGKERDYTVVSMTPVENSISEKR